MKKKNFRSCFLHPDKQLQFFCLNCNEKICEECLNKDHSKHSCSIEAVFKNEITNKLSGRMLNASLAKSQISQNIALLRDTLKSFRYVCDSVSNEYNKCCQGFKSILAKINNYPMLSQISFLEQKLRKDLRKATQEEELIKNLGISLEKNEMEVVKLLNMKNENGISEKFQANNIEKDIKNIKKNVSDLEIEIKSQLSSKKGNANEKEFEELRKEILDQRENFNRLINQSNEQEKFISNSIQLIKKQNTEKEQTNYKEIHHGINCHFCEDREIIGIRYQCNICENFNICEECVKEIGHQHDLQMVIGIKPKLLPSLQKEVHSARNEEIKVEYKAQFTKSPEKNFTVRRGEKFEKEWIVSNNGKDAWPVGTIFAPNKPSPFKIFEVQVGDVKHREVKSIKVKMQAPDNLGVFTVFFCLKAGITPIGLPVWITITVEDNVKKSEDIPEEYLANVSQLIDVNPRWDMQTIYRILKENNNNIDDAAAKLI